MIYELRRYTLHPGRRDTLIELFEREFVESQEAAGIGLAGHFRDLDAPDIFCWMRKFPDMEARRVALAAFYGGPVWKAHRTAANATMIDSDDVLLLHPVPTGLAAGDSSTFPADDPFPGTAFPLAGPAGLTGSGALPESGLPTSVYVATVHHVPEGVAGFPAFFAERVSPALAGAGMPPIACFETEHAVNTYPALPVRTGENVFVWFARFEREEDAGKAHEALEMEAALLEGQVAGAPQRFRLSPAARSALR
ncbi:NIPSNAP family protein [Nonomuraea sp. 3-1Str]|uniref:NIPSNAP family protein n=1 Tax=Nonomuraea sp. 3-1Str TaxID=2929801 RepID=UPI002856BE3C|nr:NIPSNAP family protein [Nonomuraea sp. 3-1Str]MDR8414673.1 NIPSNAP family protein [Nonomuraea sp. 3-1Str]